MLAALLVWLLLCGTALAQSSPATLSDYEALLREAHAAAQRDDLPGLRAVSERIQQISQVRLPNEQMTPVDNAWLAQSIAKQRPDLEAIAGRLGAQLEALIAAKGDDPQALQKLAEILSKPPFVQETRSEDSSSSWIEDILDSIGEFFSAIFEALGLAGLSIGQVLLTLVALGALAAGGIYLIRLLRGSLIRERRLKPKKEQAEDPTTSLSAIERAQQVASGGDYRSAVRYLYLSTLLLLHERNMLRYDRALTNHEVLQSVPPGTPLRARLQPVISTFDRVWYGHHHLDQQMFEQYRQQVTALREGAP